MRGAHSPESLYASRIFSAASFRAVHVRHREIQYARFGCIIDVRIPRVPRPRLEPDPIALPLLSAEHPLVRRVRPVPVEQRYRCTPGAEPIARRDHRFLDEALRAVIERLRGWPGCAR